MVTYIPYIQIAIAVLLIILILFQQRGTALGSAFGGGGGGEGSGFYATRRGIQQKIFWATIALGILFIGLSLLTLGL
ncbi:MAG: preprotein translocase subunit SecG [Minisyncoccales bacterium]